MGDKNDIETQNVLKQVGDTLNKMKDNNNTEDLLKQVEEAKNLLQEAQSKVVNINETKNFIEQLQMERQILVENDVDIEMKKIYESMGIVD
jgi:hypothetical protein